MRETPIVYRDGKKVEMNVGSSDWLDGSVIQKEMEYISRMTEGLATGTKSSDKEYIALKEKIINDLIGDKVASLKKDLCKTAKKKTNIYRIAEEKQKEATERIHDIAKASAKDNSQAIRLNDATGEYEIFGAHKKSNVAKRHYSDLGSHRWQNIDGAELHDEMNKRKCRAETIKKVAESKLENIVKEVKKKTTKKKIVNKKIAKKKVVKKKAKKNDRK